MEVVVAAVFALVAGAGTALSPCVLPVLPAVLSGAASGGRRRPLGIALGLAASFTFATLALAYVVDALGLPDGLLRTLAILVLLGFGVALAVPPVAGRLEAWLSRAVPQRAARRVRADGDGLRSGLVLGASLGLLYAPCAGPVLAAVLTLQASQPLTAGRLVVGLAYALGTTVAVLGLMVAGRRAIGRLVPHARRLQQGFGAVMVLVAVLMLADVDSRFRTTIADALPAFVYNPTSALEESAAARDALASTRVDRGHGAGVAERATAALEDYGVAPDFAGTQRWFNTPGGRPLSLGQLEGRVVLVDFWTYTCINCLRTLPHLRAWHERYEKAGLTIVGVHTPEFPFERDAANVARAIRDNRLRYPVAQDNDFATWNAYSNRYWPAKYLIDAAGRVRYAHFGEGEYEETERAIRALLAEAGTRAPRRPTVSSRVRAETADPRLRTPETYLGAARANGFVERPREGSRHYGSRRIARRLALNRFALRGRWRVSGHSATAQAAAAVELRFGARHVFLVLGSDDGRTRRVRVLLDGRQVPERLAGNDVRDGVVRVREQRLYRLVDLGAVSERALTLEVDPGVSAYAFTFG